MIKLINLLNEATIGELPESSKLSAFISTLKMLDKNVTIDSDIYQSFKKSFINSIRNNIKKKSAQLPAKSKEKFDTFTENVLKPFEAASDLTQFLAAMTSLLNTEHEMLKDLLMKESLIESRILDLLKKAKTASMEWWEKNKKGILLYVGELLANFVVQFFFAILNALLKSKIDAPTIKFGGGKFGGGGAGGSY